MKCAIISTTRDIAPLARTAGSAWTEFGHRTLIWLEESAWDGVVQRGHQANLQLEDRPIKGGLFLVSQVGKTFQQANPDVRTALKVDTWSPISRPVN